MRYIQSSAFRITAISLVALILAHTMVTTYFPNLIVNLLGMLATTLFIYAFTLKNNDIFSYVMVIYFCSLFPYLLAKGGGFNHIALTSFMIYFLLNKKIPGELKVQGNWFTYFVVLLSLSSTFGWIFNFEGSGEDLSFSISSFFGLMTILIVSSKLIISEERINVFLKVNFVILIYHLITSINKYIHLITVNSPMMPIYGYETGYFEGGGTIGSSPLYGEHSLLVSVLFVAALFLSKKDERINNWQLIGLILSVINVFFSISRSVFMLTILGVVLVYILTIRIKRINIFKIFALATLFIFISLGTYYIIEQFQLDYVITRMEEIDEKNEVEGGITIGRILNGSAFNRSTAFEEASKRFWSRESWVIGNGWGLPNNNRFAFYVDTSIKRGSAHSQIFAILFIFGWIGIIAYYGLYFWIMIKSYWIIKKSGSRYSSNVFFAVFSLVSNLVFIINEIKADSSSNPAYFAATLILLGLAYSNYNHTLYSIRGKFQPPK